jgi:hypothetical protein
VPAGSSALHTPNFCPIQRDLSPDLTVGGANGWRCSYRLQIQLADVRTGQEENLDQSQGFRWKEIWHTKCTPTVRQFLWRIAHNSLPVRLNLQRRGIDIDPICPSCNRLNEDGCHLFFRCKKAKVLWQRCCGES